MVHAPDLRGVPATSVWTERDGISQQLLEHLGKPQGELGSLAATATLIHMPEQKKIDGLMNR